MQGLYLTLLEGRFCFDFVHEDDLGAESLRPYPIGPQTVKVEVPGGRKIARVQLLRVEQDLPFSQDGDRVEFTSPAVTDYEVAALST